jgi:uncharacterized protein YcbX
MAEFRISEMWIYPIKALGGIRVKQSKVKEKGLEFDRRMMLLNSGNKFLTQRDENRFALFRPSIVDGRITVAFGSEMLTIEDTRTGDSVETMVWDDPVTVVEMNKNYSAWFSNQLGFDCKLVSFPESNARPVNPQRSINKENVSLADGYPFLILGQSSLDYLNSKLDVPLPMNRFRPNLVFTGGKPHDEDFWKEFTVGSNRFVGIKPCARCVVTTINQDSADKGVEPLKTFATYRKFEKEIYFGQNAVAQDCIEVQEGDIITVQSYLEDEISNNLSRNL